MARIPLSQVDERVVNMPMVVLQCRKMGHAWQERPLGKHRRNELRGTGVIEELFMCLRCKLRRCDVIDEDTYDKVGTSYPDGYPEGYAAPRGSGRIPRREARLAYAARARRG